MATKPSQSKDWPGAFQRVWLHPRHCLVWDIPCLLSWFQRGFVAAQSLFRIHGIAEPFGLEGTFKGHLVPLQLAGMSSTRASCSASHPTWLKNFQASGFSSFWIQVFHLEPQCWLLCVKGNSEFLGRWGLKIRPHLLQTEQGQSWSSHPFMDTIKQKALPRGVPEYKEKPR